MSFFHRKPKTPDLPAFDMNEFEPVLRCSICTGEQIACFQNRKTGELQEVMLIRGDAELAAFCQRYGLDPGNLRKVY